MPRENNLPPKSGAGSPRGRGRGPEGGLGGGGPERPAPSPAPSALHRILSTDGKPGAGAAPQAGVRAPSILDAAPPPAAGLSQVRAAGCGSGCAPGELGQGSAAEPGRAGALPRVPFIQAGDPLGGGGGMGGVRSDHVGQRQVPAAGRRARSTSARCRPSPPARLPPARLWRRSGLRVAGGGPRGGTRGRGGPSPPSALHCGARGWGAPRPGRRGRALRATLMTEHLRQVAAGSGEPGPHPSPRGL